MIKQYLTAAACGLCLLCTLNSCINKEYDWDNLNKEITFQVGNVPLGNVSPIRIDSILEDRGNTEFQYDASGNVFLQYRGDIDIDIPAFKDITVDDKETRRTDLRHKLGSNPIPPIGAIELLNDKIDYQIPAPENNNNGDWEIDITSVLFEFCDLWVDLYMTNVTFEAGKSELQIDLEFPDYISFREDANVEDNKITIFIDPTEVPSCEGLTIKNLPIERFNYGDSKNIHYTISLTVNEEITPSFTDAESELYIVLRTPDPQPLLVYADANFKQNIDGDINDIDALNEIFQDGDYFTLNNPGMIFYMQTNLAFDFNVSIDNMSAFYTGGTNPESISPVTPGGMNFLKEDSGNKIGYYIAQTNDSTTKFDQNHFFSQDLNKLVSVKPVSLTYDITAGTAEWKEGVFPFNDPYMDAEYLFNVPFNFKEISVSFEEVMEDVFSDDIAEKLFNNEGEFIIVADEVIVQLGGPSSQADVTLFITATVYDYTNEPIDIEIVGATLSNGTNPLEIVMKISKEDTYKMQSAKHIGFSFKIKGENLTLNKSDYIAINKLKFKTTGGFSWEF
ncbi:MAG: DUF4621 domain-containing protein [Tannerellaceae bacterium]|nr:DUF4621 domain-containing protein [Tannerellaceae bacterium]